MVDWTSLIIGSVGAITGIVSLVWHITNSRSRVILERLYFEKAHRHTHKETIDIEATIRNKSNRATTIEDMYLEVGKNWIKVNSQTPTKIEPNSSHKFKFSQSFTPEEFKDILEIKPVKLGLTIIHTFGKLKKQGFTDFSSDYLTVV